MPVNPSLRELQEALRISREIESLEKRLAKILSGKGLARRRVSAGTRVKFTGTVATHFARAPWHGVRAKAKSKSSDIPTKNPGTKAYHQLLRSKA